MIAADVDFVEPPGANWVLGRMGVAWDESSSSMVLVCEQFLDEEESEAGVEARIAARFRLSVAQVVAFIELARDIVASGRPPCYLCGLPMDPGRRPQLN